MKKYFLYIIISLSSYGIITPQNGNTLFCLSGKEFKIPQMSLLTGYCRNFKVSFDVVNLIPQNIRVIPLDSSVFVQEDYLKSTKENLKVIDFLKDTTNVEITFNYFVKSGRDISTNYAESISEKEINLVFRKLIRKTMDPAMYHSNDTIVVYGFIPITIPSEKKSDVLVEKIFLSEGDSTIIVRNNFPELTNEILKSSKWYNKEYFLSIFSNAKKFFIRYVVYLSYPDCDGFTLFYD